MVCNIMVPDDRSPISLAYWEKRQANKQHKTWSNYESRLKLAKKQYHICPICEESLYNNEELHVHHIIPKKKGGKYSFSNCIIVHELCHRQIHSLGLSEDHVKDRIKTLRMKMSRKLKDSIYFYTESPAILE